MTVLEKSPKGDSQSNGLAERSVRGLEEMLRVHKLDLKERLKDSTKMDHVAVEWLVEHNSPEMDILISISGSVLY